MFLQTVDGAVTVQVGLEKQLDDAAEPRLVVKVTEPKAGAEEGERQEQRLTFPVTVLPILRFMLEQQEEFGFPEDVG